MMLNLKIKEELQKHLVELVTKERLTTVLITAYKLSKEELEEIKKQTFLKERNIVNVVNKDIIAGIIIKFGTKIIDLSLIGQLKNFKRLTYEIN